MIFSLVTCYDHRPDWNATDWVKYFEKNHPNFWFQVKFFYRNCNPRFCNKMSGMPCITDKSWTEGGQRKKVIIIKKFYILNFISLILV